MDLVKWGKACQVSSGEAWRTTNFNLHLQGLSVALWILNALLWFIVQKIIVTSAQFAECVAKGSGLTLGRSCSGEVAWVFAPVVDRTPTVCGPPIQSSRGTLGWMDGWNLWIAWNNMHRRMHGEYLLWVQRVVRWADRVAVPLGLAVAEHSSKLCFVRSLDDAGKAGKCRNHFKRVTQRKMLHLLLRHCHLGH